MVFNRFQKEDRKPLILYRAVYTHFTLSRYYFDSLKVSDPVKTVTGHKAVRHVKRSPVLATRWLVYDCMAGCISVL